MAPVCTGIRARISASAPKLTAATAKVSDGSHDTVTPTSCRVVKVHLHLAAILAIYQDCSTTSADVEQSYDTFHMHETRCKRSATLTCNPPLIHQSTEDPKPSCVAALSGLALVVLLAAAGPPRRRGRCRVRAGTDAWRGALCAWRAAGWCWALAWLRAPLVNAVGRCPSLCTIAAVPASVPPAGRHWPVCLITTVMCVSVWHAWR
jgi:hypothetical protein